MASAIKMSMQLAQSFGGTAQMITNEKIQPLGVPEFRGGCLYLKGSIISQMVIT
jgi:hypothetical protein